MRMPLVMLFVLTFGIVSAAPPKVVEELSGKVISVTDGDTIKVLVGKETVTVRLDGIDAPESGQSYGRKSKDHLNELVAGKTVKVQKTGTDKYKRTLGVVIVGNINANAKMVEDGWAWHYKKYNDEDHLAQLEVTARKEKRGLWADATPLPPWEYRSRQKEPEKAGEEQKQESFYWLNSSSGVRHNSRCEHFQKTKKGRFCGANEGKACGICGG